MQEVNDSFIVSKNNTPLDARTRIRNLSDMSNILRPYVGMLVYVTSANRLYIVTELTSRQFDNGVILANDQVKSYEEVLTDYEPPTFNINVQQDTDNLYIINIVTKDSTTMLPKEGVIVN